jgi:hypothetical protein
MDAVRDLPKEGSKEQYSEANELAVASKYVDSFISFKVRSVKRYKEIMESTPYDNMKRNLGYLIGKEEECIGEAKALKELIDEGMLEGLKLRKERDMQIYDHFESTPLKNLDGSSFRDILKAAISDDKEMIDRLSIVSIENADTKVGKAAEHLISSIIASKNIITSVLLSFDSNEW